MNAITILCDTLCRDHGGPYHVPLLMRGPGITSGTRSPALVDLLDLVPTVLR